MHDTEVPRSNAVTLAQAVAAVAREVARTGLDVASISVTRDYGDSVPICVSVQAATDDLASIARLFPGLPLKPCTYGDGLRRNAKHEGRWVGMGITVNVYGAARAEVTA